VSAVRQEPRPAPARPRSQGRPRARRATRRPTNARHRLARSYLGRHLGPVPLGPLICWQLALGLLVVGIVRGGLLLVLGLLAVVVVAVFTLIPVNARPLWRAIGVWMAFNSRGSRAQIAPPHDPELAPLREWLPELELTSIVGKRGGPQIGVCYDGSAYVVVLGPDGEDLISSAEPVNVPLRALADVGQAEGVRLASAQLVVRTVPAPAPTLGPYGAQLAESYHEVNQMAAAPALVSWWIALRLEPSWSGSSFALESDDEDGIRRGLRRAAAAATRVLSSSGLPCRSLDENEFRDVLELTTAADPRQVPPAARVRRSKETWLTWACDGSAHATAWVRRWPSRGLPSMAQLLGAMAGLPALSATASLTLSWPPEHEVRCAAYVRLTADSPRNARAGLDHLSRGLTRNGFGLTKLDGEQLPGLLATIPLGGAPA
jgi:type VII secretion protein EccE